MNKKINEIQHYLYFFIFLTTEEEGLLAKETNETEEPISDIATHQEEAIELVVVNERVNEAVKCFNCEDVFDSISLFEDHLSSLHQIDRQALIAYTELVLNKTTIKEGNLIHK